MMKEFVEAPGVGVKHIEPNGVAFPDQRPVYADMEPAKEHLQEIHQKLQSAAQQMQAAREELAEFVRVNGREIEKAKNLMRRYGVES
jgi:hypothetical protein